jgi:hypothetical protein
MSDQTNSGAGGGSGGAELPGAVLDTAAAAPLTASTADVDVLVGLAGQAGITLSRERAATLAAPLAAVVDGVRRAMPSRRDQIAPALVFRAPREV